MNYRHNGGPLGEGWIARHRSVREHWLVGHGIQVKPADPNRKRTHAQGEAWEDLTMECRYEDGTVMNGGKKMELRRGELVGAVSWLAHRWNWTPKTVRRFLDQLENDGMIELKKPGVEMGMQKGKQANVVSICNYDFYQFGFQSEGQAKGNADGKQGASKGQAEGNIYKDNKGTREQDKEPPTPLAGGEVAEPEFPGLPVEKPKAAAIRRDCEAALEIYNKAAAHFGFARCEMFTEARRKRMAKRLADVGGVERFRLALRTLAQPDPFTDLLLGKRKPREGEKPFRLDFDRFLQTEGNLGDVIARLLDISSSDDPAKAREPPWAHWDEDEWRRQIAKHANGIWPVDKLSPPPASKKTACPPRVIESERLLERYDENGFARGRH